MKSANQALRIRLAQAMPAHLPPLAERRRLRTAARLSEAALGGLIGVSGVSIARWELGRREPEGDLRSRYSEVLTLIAEQLGEEMAR